MNFVSEPKKMTSHGFCSPGNSQHSKTSIYNDINQTNIFCQLTNQLIDLAHGSIQCLYILDMAYRKRLSWHSCTPSYLSTFASLQHRDAGWVLYECRCTIYAVCRTLQLSKSSSRVFFPLFSTAKQIKLLLGGLKLKSPEGTAQSSSNLVSASELKPLKKTQQYHCNKCMFNYYKRWQSSEDLPPR